MSQREDAKKQIKKLLEERYTSGKNRWFFQPLRVRTVLSFSFSLRSPFTLRPLLPLYSTHCHLSADILPFHSSDLFGFCSLLLCSLQNRYMYITCPRMTHAPHHTSCLNP